MQILLRSFSTELKILLVHMRKELRKYAILICDLLALSLYNEVLNSVELMRGIENRYTRYAYEYTYNRYTHMKIRWDFYIKFFF